MKKLLFILTFVFASVSSYAQQAEMASTFYSEGKIYVVVGVLLIILIGIFAYLFVTERKLNRIEKELQK